ncbi:TPA: ATPase [Vibrio diabolicus]|uniref:ATPase n=1 Tax=Vibrio diabolicus TaxID=50719 RepID=UPI00211A9D8A|nr:ATPase [Vibrio diabolicus]
MINKLNWILLFLLFPLMGHANIQCNPSSWNDNLTQFNRLESNYNKHVEVFNALLAEHKQRQLLSQTFSLHELVLLWRARSNQNAFKTQLKASIQYKEELTTKANELIKLSTQSQWSANGWKKLAQKCRESNETANQITAEWYNTNALQLTEDYKRLSSQYQALAQLYDKEARSLQYAQDVSR